MSNLIYTNIQHIPRKKWGLSLNEYAIADMIYHLSNNPDYKWCIMTKRDMAEEIGFSKNWILKLIERLIELWLVEKNPQTKHLRTTQLWYDEFVTTGKQSWPDLVNKVDQLGKQSWPNNNTNNNINNNSIINNTNKSGDLWEAKSQEIEKVNHSREDINQMQDFIKNLVEEAEYTYKPWKQERNRIKNILTAKQINWLAEKHWMTIYDFVWNIFYLSEKLDFWNWKIYNAETLYKHYPKIYNDWVKLKKQKTTQEVDYWLDYWEI